jgi:hypothetical protein
LLSEAAVLSVDLSSFNACPIWFEASILFIAPFLARRRASAGPPNVRTAYFGIGLLRRASGGRTLWAIGVPPLSVSQIPNSLRRSLLLRQN